ncbi:MAG: tyrosine-type recombinase/integrase, partial [Candidatus Tectomicrobia bacterium]|nr:tyrosine-type recombinase/integrase [Candidatus Tectomicrobia bacterium]
SLSMPSYALFAEPKKSPFPKQSRISSSIASKAPKIKWEIDPRKCFTREEVCKLLEAAENRKKTATKCGVRDWLYVTISLMTGLRISEVAALKCKDVFFSRSALFPHIFVANGKGGKARRVPINRRTIKALIEYRIYKQTWGEDWWEEEALLRSPTGGHYSRWGLAQMFRRVLRLTDIEHQKRFTPHSLRHSYASHLFKATGNIKIVSDFLGHTSVVVTEVYISLMEERCPAIEKLYRS